MQVSFRGGLSLQAPVSSSRGPQAALKRAQGWLTALRVRGTPLGAQKGGVGEAGQAEDAEAGEDVALGVNDLGEELERHPDPHRHRPWMRNTRGVSSFDDLNTNITRFCCST